MSQSQSGNWGVSLLAIAALLSSAGAIAAGIWLAIQLMLDPDTAIWLHRFLPERTKRQTASYQAPQTLAEIRTNIAREGKIPGKVLDLQMPLENRDKQNPSTSEDVLLPVLQRRLGCQTACEYVSQIRVYRIVKTPHYFAEDRPYYQLATLLSISSLEEALAADAKNTQLMYDANLQRPHILNSNRQHRMTSVEIAKLEPEAIAGGALIHLSGGLKSGNDGNYSAQKPMAYGQLLYYNPNQINLLPILTWTNKAGNAPVWQEVSGGGSPELIIDRTVGFEPKFQVYQLQPRKFLPAPIYLEEISFTSLALTSNAYQNALMLARRGLWTPAATLLEPLSTAANWSRAAQAQLDLISWHSRVSRSQADKSWASPSQEVLASIIDGRLSAALEVFRASPQNRREIARLLKVDSGSLWERVDAALRVSPERLEAIAWAALIRSAKDGRSGAIAWLRKQPSQKSASNPLIEELLDGLDEARFVSGTQNVSSVIEREKALGAAESSSLQQPERDRLENQTR